MAISHARSMLAGTTSGSVSSTTRTFSASASVGETILVWIGTRSGATSTVSSVTDTAGNTYSISQLGSSSGVRGGAAIARARVDSAITSGSTQITINLSTANIITSMANAFTNLDTTSAGTGTNSGSGTSQTVTINPSQDGAMFVLVNFYQDFNVGSNSATGTGFSELRRYDNTTSMTLFVDWNSSVASGANRTGGNTGSSVNWAAAGIVLPEMVYPTDQAIFVM